MGTWPDENLARVGNSEELTLASRRVDGSLSGFVTMWVVRVDDDVYVRSAGGPDRPWYRPAVTAGAGVIRAGGVERTVTFAPPTPDVQTTIDAAYHAKYDRYGPGIVGSVVGPAAHEVTLRLVPAEGGAS